MKKNLTQGRRDAESRTVRSISGIRPFTSASSRLCVLSLCLVFIASGCNTWTGRMFMLSLERMSNPTEPAPSMITTPYRDDADLAVAWAGHATTLIQMKDKLIMTDPLLNNSVAIVVKRWVAPGLDPSVLPKLDATLISHTHFDHLNLGSLDQLPTDGILVVPRGALQFVPDFGFRALHELDTWEAIEEDGLRITAVPVQHFGGRYGIDRNWTQGLGYTGYVIEYGGLTVYFGGDTGYHERYFKEVGERFEIDLAIIPIGPGDSPRLGGRIHVEPGGALQIFHDLGAQYFLPMHHGTIPYTSDREPSSSITTLRRLALDQNLGERLVDLGIGEQRVLYGNGRASGREASAPHINRMTND